jgi:hygromycin-B 7''-O-kinase
VPTVIFAFHIDFGDSMIGLPEYDLLGPSVFLGNGDLDLIHALFHGYGYSDTNKIDFLQRKLLLLQILHRYSDFRSQLRIRAWEDRVRNFQELAELIWPLKSLRA